MFGVRGDRKNIRSDDVKYRREYVISYFIIHIYSFPTKPETKTPALTMIRRASFTAVPGLLLVIVFILSTCNDNKNNNKHHTVNAYQTSVFGSRKHHFTATTKREQRFPTAPLLFRCPSSLLFQSKSSSVRTEYRPQATVEPFDNNSATNLHHERSDNVLSKFNSLFRVMQRLKWFLQQQQRQFWHLQRHCEKMFLPILFSLMLCFSILSSAWAVPGGRMGGSFGKSSSSPSSSSSSSYYSRPSQSSSSSSSYSLPSQLSRPYYSNNSPQVRVSRPRTQSYYFDEDDLDEDDFDKDDFDDDDFDEDDFDEEDLDEDSPYYYRSRRTSRRVEEEVPTRLTAANVAVLTGLGLVLVANDIRFRYKYRKRKNNNDPDNRSSKSALGWGVTVASLTVALNVPQRDDANNMLTKLHRLSQSARTDTRQGLQELVSTGTVT